MGYTVNQSTNKLRGGYYTPTTIAEFLSKWAVKGKGSRVLEPSCGDGQFLISLTKLFGNDISITAIELVKEEAEKAKARGNKKTDVIVSDAFKWYEENLPDGEFDAVVGNPPFIRFQNFPEEHRLKAFRIMREQKLSPTRLTNSWVPFLILATKALKPNGRLGLIVPAELLQVSYARDLRRYLSTKYKNLTIVTFRHLVFPDIQQEIVLLLGERGDCITSKISLLEFENLDDLQFTELATKLDQHRILDINHDNEKWTQFYLTRSELDLIRSIESSNKFTRLGDIAEVDVGVVTGNNNFFIVNLEKAKELNILDYCSPIVGRSNHLSGLSFGENDYLSKSKLGEKMLLFNPGKIGQHELTKEAITYILLAEKSGVADGYKCNIRKPFWWNVPSTWKPDAFLLRQIHEGPKIIANLTDATSTDTVHRIRMKNNISANLLSIASYNSLTFALAEISGRSYGGGVLELEPSEAENLLVPNLDLFVDISVKDLDRLVREKNTNEALDIVDSIYLKKSGLSSNEVLTLRTIWQKLMNRRHSRNKKSSPKSYSVNPLELSSIAWGGNPLYLEV